jgi:hypothetical protein
VNEATTLEAPTGAIDQMVHALKRIIHAFAEADEDAKIFMAKWDIKHGFWRMDVQEGEEWNFCYVLPQREGEPTRLVVPTSLQMGWVESRMCEFLMTPWVTPKFTRQRLFNAWPVIYESFGS